MKKAKFSNSTELKIWQGTFFLTMLSKAFPTQDLFFNRENMEFKCHSTGSKLQPVDKSKLESLLNPLRQECSINKQQHAGPVPIIFNSKKFKRVRL